MENRSLWLRKSDRGSSVMCRLCMKYHEHFRTIFAWNVECGLLVWTVIQDLLNEEVSEDDGLPETVCHKCEGKLVEFRDFKEMCVNSGTELRKYSLDKYLQMEIKKEVDANESLSETEAHCQESLDQIANVVCLPIKIGDEGQIKEEVDSCEPHDEAKDYADEDIEESKPEIVEKDFNPCKSPAEGQIITKEEESSDGEGGWTESMPTEMEADVCVKEEIGVCESMPEDEPLNQEDFGEDEYPAFKVLCLPLGVGDMVGDSNVAAGLSMTKGSKWSGQIGERQERLPNLVDDEHRLTNKSALTSKKPQHWTQNDQYLHQDSQGEMENHYANTFNVNDLIHKDTLELESREKLVSYGAEYVCNYCGMRCPDRNSLLMHISDHVFSRTPSIGEIAEKGLSPVCSTSGIKPQERSATLIGDGMYEDESNQGSCAAEHSQPVAGNNDSKPFQCDLCGKGFSKKHYLWKHSFSHDDKLKPFECEICKKRFRDKGFLLAHSVVHSKSKPHKCEICGKEFSLERYLLNHMVVHNISKPYVCDICGKGFSHKKSLTTHSYIHADLKQFKCQTCGRGFNDPGTLSRHMERHGQVRAYKCEECSREFVTKSDLTKHSYTHNRSKGFTCEVCREEFSSKATLLSHAVVHSGFTPVKCVTCSKDLYGEDDVQRHVALHSRSKSVKCEVCAKEFYDRAALKKHSVVHSDLRPFKCDECGMSFKLKFCLDKHLAIHSEVKPFECEQCGKEFRRKADLLTHAVIHTNSKPFGCEICGRRFNQKSALKMHSKSHSGYRP
ncbi:zinc finger protein 724-like isoform X2 [Ischnura elegans]|uniref:zinc finger protein 724-like isoform X2 n=1 Tax=Ischnura elegans TaxID=197161 RepID=UPI001ED87E90|nr:zinc finger protein 724-like isoform X2 [Ischnura elegans]